MSKLSQLFKLNRSSCGITCLWTDWNAFRYAQKESFPNQSRNLNWTDWIGQCSLAPRTDQINDFNGSLPDSHSPIETTLVQVKLFKRKNAQHFNFSKG